MIPLVLFTIAVFAYNTNNFSQNNNDVGILPQDTVYRFQGIIPPVEFQFDLNQLYKQPVTIPAPKDILLNEDASTIWLRTEMMFSGPVLLSNQEYFDNHFTSTLYEKHLEESEFDMVRYVLGMAQLSAVAYMAYRHIKKYGFLR